MGLDFFDSSRHPFSRDVPLNLPGPQIDRSAAKQELNPEIEIEAKFFLPRTLAKKLTSSARFMQIEQRYFKRELIKSLLEEFIVPNRSGPIDLSGLSIARIRRTREPGQEAKYFIEFKGEKGGSNTARISRREISEPITAKDYKALKERATAGILRKRRYSIPGTITIDGRSIAAVAQIDCLQAAGKKLHKVKTKFDTVDIELQDPAHIDALRSGHHSFSFLARSIELSANNGRLAKVLTTRRIAKNGLDPDAVKAIKKLESIAGRLHEKDRH